MKKYLKRIVFALAIVLTLGFGNVNKVHADTYMTTTANLNVRSGASTKHKKIGLLKKGAKARVVSTKNGWCKIKYGNKYGWCCKQYLKSGTKSNKSTKSGSKKSVKRTLKVKAYAYTGHGITSTGRRPVAGRTIAVDPRVIPYGSKVYIPALGRTYIAEDCGGGIKGNKIDVYMSSQSACRQFGVKYLTVQIIK